MKDSLSVIIVDQQLDNKGVLVNLGFVLGLTSGRHMPDNTFGPDVIDGDGKNHKYLTNIGHYVRKAGQSKIRSIRQSLADNPDVLIVDYTEDAAPADYSSYEKSLGAHKEEEIVYRAIHVCGPSTIIEPLTKNLSRLS